MQPSQCDEAQDCMATGDENLDLSTNAYVCDAYGWFSGRIRV
jgi:hypothetical protein